MFNLNNMKNLFLKSVFVLTLFNLPNFSFAAITLDPPPSSCPLYDKFEITFPPPTSLASPANPYNPNQFNYFCEFWNDAAGKYYKVNAFFFNGVDTTANNCQLDYTLSPYAQFNQILTENSTKRWMVRFTPNVGGTWKYRITAIDGSGTQYFPSASTFNTFTCSGTTASPSNKGFISTANHRYLKFDNGDPYYPLGTSTPFFFRDLLSYPTHSNGNTVNFEHGSCEIKYDMNDMALNKENFMRYEVNMEQAINIYGVDYRDGKNYYSFFNQKDSWQLDDIINYAHSKGIYLDLMLFAFADLSDANSQPAWENYSPYNKHPGTGAYTTFPVNNADISGTC